MAQMAPFFSAIGNGAQSLFGTSALAGAGSSAAGGAAAGASSGAANGFFGNGMFGQIMSGAKLNTGAQLGGTIGDLLAAQLESGGGPPAAPQAGGNGSLFQGLGKELGLEPKPWATPKYDTNEFINMLLSGRR